MKQKRSSSGRRAFALAGVAALLAATAAPAHLAPPGAAAPANTVSPLILTAPDAHKDLVDPTTQFVRQHLPESTFSEQFPRFRDEICVRVVGLPAEFNAFVEKRLGEIAVQVKAPLSKAGGCTPNVDVIFTTEPQALLTDIAKRKDILLGFYWNETTLKRLAAFKRPIGAWYVTRTRSASGESRLEIHDPTDYQNPRVGRAGSRLSNGMSSEIVHSLIVADSNKVAGQKIEAIADYVAVLALAKWQRLEECNGMHTILNLMADGCDVSERPEAATRMDLALLSGLYSVETQVAGSQQRMSIASRIRAAEKGADETQR
jgi:hypothetical protein